MTANIIILVNVSKTSAKEAQSSDSAVTHIFASPERSVTTKKSVLSSSQMAFKAVQMIMNVKMALAVMEEFAENI
eukprot:CAMPEP_0202954106 /NCGR_PEP_ID=MMETSP1395-20130829/50565_1 /ASSEMBLY_ACC=CAM_ASM_000871 /TAXON_ID=5961 /ORGANISM="Blepharisma japonicum, Strain Stock R1072" /LENGTH=74 /DNA_ID=CAMNT_0049669469 /DNA_START=281 /DNA_END=505 /DNA_ORIENTATION=+